jgi:multidrug efflux pump subunit AcrB
VRQKILENSLEHGRMTSLSDTLTVGLVLVLLFGSIALYLYTRIQQAEQKISLLESILLDLKMSAEVKSYSELPAANVIQKTGGFSTEQNDMSYTPFNEYDENDEDDDEVYPGAVVGSSSPIKSGSPTPSVSSRVDGDVDNEVNEYRNVIADAVKADSDVKESSSKLSANYEAMTLKELQTLAKTRGISGAGSMKKGAIIEALKTSDRSSGPVQPGSIGAAGSFLDTSSPFQASTVAESE